MGDGDHGVFRENGDCVSILFNDIDTIDKEVSL